MKRITLLLVIVFSTSAAFAWPACSGNWVSVPSTTKGTASSGYGSVVTENGQTFQCDPTTPPSTNPSGSTASSSSNSTSGATSSSTSGSKSGSRSNATGGSATGGNSSSTSAGGSVAGSGNSSNTNRNVANGGAGGTGIGIGGSGGSSQQGQSQSSTSSATGNGNGSNNYSSVTNVAAPHIPVNAAYNSTVIPTANCMGGFSAGLTLSQIGLAGGSSREAKNCALLETARSFDANNERLAACKVKITSKYSKAAHVTLADCMQQELMAAPPIGCRLLLRLQPSSLFLRLHAASCCGRSCRGGSCSISRWSLRQADQRVCSVVGRKCVVEESE